MADTEPRTTPSRRSPRRSPSPKALTAVGIGVLAAVFVLQNTSQKHIRFLLWSWSMPAWIWLVVMFAAGVVVGSIFPWLRRRRS
jgi:uncharacterized integral membrane protein